MKAKHKHIARLCRRMMVQSKLSGRAMSRALRIHHKTWQRYLRGSHLPSAEIRERMVRLMGAESFRTLSHPSGPELNDKSLKM